MISTKVKLLNGGLPREEVDLLLSALRKRYRGEVFESVAARRGMFNIEWENTWTSDVSDEATSHREGFCVGYLARLGEEE